jgi:eukaryotic-like serine/threonine-protein kinase
MTNKKQMAGEQGGTHETICLLGEGGMARVYLAFTRGPANVHKLVVMKQMHSELARDQRFVTMFLDEARIATRLNHPNVVHTYGVLEEDGKYTLMMEYLDGQSLSDILQRIDLQYFPLPEHLWILTQVLSALEYAHSLTDYDGAPLGLVHRDISPGNTFVTYNGVVKLLDFGIAKARGAVSVTQKGDFKGKLNYCAPEQIEPDSPPDARTDLFAVGVMLWEALARRRIAGDSGYLQMAQTRLKGREPKIRQICPDVSPALAAICDRAMALKPADRYLTAADFQNDLRRYLDSTGKRVGRVQVAELMHQHFLQEQSDMRRRIEEHLNRIREDSVVTSFESIDTYADVLPIGIIRAPDKRPSPAPAFLTAIAETSDDFGEMRTEQAVSPPSFWHAKPPVSEQPGSLLPAADVPAPKTEPRKPWASRRELALLGVLAVVTTATVAWWRIDTQKRVAVPNVQSISVASQEPAPPPPPVVEEPAVAVAEAAPESAAVTTTAAIHIDIVATPANATLTLDGKAIKGNRLQTEVPRDEEPHVIRAVAPGYQPFSRAVTFSSDVRLAIHLVKGDRARAMKAYSQPENSDVTVTDSPEPAPAEEGPKDKKGSSIIDESNPYER